MSPVDNCSDLPAMCIRLKRRWRRLLFTKFWGSWWFLHWSSERSQTNGGLPESNILATSHLPTFFERHRGFFFAPRKVAHDIYIYLPSRDTVHVTVQPFSEWHAIFSALDRSLFDFVRLGTVQQFAFPNLFMTSQAGFFAKKVVWKKSCHSRPQIWMHAQVRWPGHVARTCLANAALRETQFSRRLLTSEFRKGMYNGCKMDVWMVHSLGYGHNLPCDFHKTLLKACQLFQPIPVLTLLKHVHLKAPPNQNSKQEPFWTIYFPGSETKMRKVPFWRELCDRWATLFWCVLSE